MWFYPDRQERNHRNQRTESKTTGRKVNAYFCGGDQFVVTTWDDEPAQKSNVKRRAPYFNEILDREIYPAPSPLEEAAVSTEHTGEEIEKALQAAEKSPRRILTIWEKAVSGRRQKHQPSLVPTLAAFRRDNRYRLRSVVGLEKFLVVQQVVDLDEQGTAF